MLDVVCWKWKPVLGYRSSFGAPQVNVLRAMVARHYAKPYRFTCITDDPAGIDPRVRVLPLWSDHALIPSPHGGRNPSCYRRLRMFASDAGALIGERMLSIDLDTVITDDVTAIWDRPEDFVIWEGTAGKNPYNGSMILLRAGTRTAVWDDFDPGTSPKRGAHVGYVGSDQAWIAYKLGSQEARWRRDDGVYSWRMHLQHHMRGRLPKGARIVFFHGNHDPWHPMTQRLSPWIADHWTDRENAGRETRQAGDVPARNAGR